MCKNSNTQRVAVLINDDNTVLINKEWRKTPEELWNVGKGLLLPKDKLVTLGNLLNCESEQELSQLLHMVGIEEEEFYE